MSESRNTKDAGTSRRPATGTAGSASTPEDKGFQDRLTGLLEWLADRDPVRAARLIGDYLDDLAEEIGSKSVTPAKG